MPNPIIRHIDHIIIDVRLAYTKLGMAIFTTLRLNIIANTIETTESITAERNIRLNESAEGKYCAIP